MLSSAAGLLTDQSFLSVFCAAMLTIGIGWGLRKKNILKAESQPVLNALLLKLTVPCLAFDAFMTDFARGELRRNVQILLISFALYLSMIALSQLIFIKYGRRKANLYGICFAIGQQTLYAMPILRAIYRENPSESMLSASMVAIAFRVMLYLYAFYSISGVAVTGGSLKQNLKKAFLTPVMLAMFAGFFIWLTQGLLPCPGGSQSQPQSGGGFSLAVSAVKMNQSRHGQTSRLRIRYTSSMSSPCRTASARMSYCRCLYSVRSQLSSASKSRPFPAQMARKMASVMPGASKIP